MYCADGLSGTVAAGVPYILLTYIDTFKQSYDSVTHVHRCSTSADNITLVVSCAVVDCRAGCSPSAHQLMLAGMLGVCGM